MTKVRRCTWPEFRKLVMFAACCCCGVMSEPTRAEAIEYPFGRLFTAADERQNLDAIKRGNKASALAVEDTVTVPMEPALTQDTSSVRFSGYIKRADGSVVLWVDGETDLSGRSDAQYKQRLSSENREALFSARSNPSSDGSDQQVRLRVGQTWMIDEGSVVEIYQGVDLMDKLSGASGDALDSAIEDPLQSIPDSPVVPAGLVQPLPKLSDALK